MHVCNHSAQEAEVGQCQKLVKSRLQSEYLSQRKIFKNYIERKKEALELPELNSYLDKAAAGGRRSMGSPG